MILLMVSAEGHDSADGIKMLKSAEVLVSVVLVPEDLEKPRVLYYS